MKLLRHIAHWLEDRTGLWQRVKALAVHPVPPGSAGVMFSAAQPWRSFWFRLSPASPWQRCMCHRPARRIRASSF